MRDGRHQSRANGRADSFERLLVAFASVIACVLCAGPMEMWGE